MCELILSDVQLLKERSNSSHERSPLTYLGPDAFPSLVLHFEVRQQLHRCVILYRT